MCKGGREEKCTKPQTLDREGDGERRYRERERELPEPERPKLNRRSLEVEGQEIADGVSKSAQAVHAAEAGIRRIGTLARRQTVSMIQERASLPIISLQPVVAGAARKTSRAVGHATKTFMNIISRERVLHFGGLDFALKLFQNKKKNSRVIIGLISSLNFLWSGLCSKVLPRREEKKKSHMIIELISC
ncbi:hypothetical protein CKAN_01518800 [Cinnamomum micranthum f. kanehirae]|uniref:Uncharacterized protein n=1 Tax=Cinnamomum micranthum f. kanehirae TaxID=337451 RepID=A0A443P6B5_9MAGN|nr:hypothetical protein CKAN_01518800 [Cinnamomum micranthum f. kanehirae]